MMLKIIFRTTFAAMLVVSFCIFASAQTREEIEAQNKNNETVARTFAAGNAALAANKLEEAIAAYREGLAVRPEGPAMLTNLSEALRRRGVISFNEALKKPEAGGKDAAAKDWLEAAELSRKALAVINRHGVDPQQQAANAKNKLAALNTYALAMRLVATKVDQTRAQAAWDASQELIAAEPDAEKKSKLKTDAIQMLYEAGELDMAIAQARISLSQDKADLATNRILGMALAATGDESKYAEAAKYLQIYLAKAPDSDPLKQPAKDVFEFIKTQVPARRGRN